MATYTIRTAAALELVEKAAQVGIIARFVKQDGEFFILQTREADEKRYSDVFDSSDWEDVASTLTGMISSAKTKPVTVLTAEEVMPAKTLISSPVCEFCQAEKEAGTVHVCEAKPVTNEQIATAIQSLEENLALMVATRADVLTWDAGFNWVISHGGVEGLYLNASGFPTGICFAQVWSNEKIHEAIAKAKTVVNGEGKQGKVCDYLNCLNRDIQAMQETISTIKAIYN